MNPNYSDPNSPNNKYEYETNEPTEFYSPNYNSPSTTKKERNVMSTIDGYTLDTFISASRSQGKSTQFDDLSQIPNGGRENIKTEKYKKGEVALDSVLGIFAMPVDLQSCDICESQCKTSEQVLVGAMICPPCLEGKVGGHTRLLPFLSHQLTKESTTTDEFHTNAGKYNIWNRLLLAAIGGCIILCLLFILIGILYWKNNEGECQEFEQDIQITPIPNITSIKTKMSILGTIQGIEYLQQNNSIPNNELKSWEGYCDHYYDIFVFEESSFTELKRNSNSKITEGRNYVSGAAHSRGGTNELNYYISGSDGNSKIGLLYKLSEPDQPPLVLEGKAGIFNSGKNCFFIEKNIGYCCGFHTENTKSQSYVFKYTFNIDFTTYKVESPIVTVESANYKFMGCTLTRSNLLIVGEENTNKCLIYTEDGEYKGELLATTGGVGVITHIAEVYINIILAVRSKAIYIFDIFDLTHLTQINIYHSDFKYLAVSPLNSPQEYIYMGHKYEQNAYFAVAGGGKGTSTLGVIEIFELNTSNLIVTLYKKALNLGLEGCQFSIIREIVPGEIYIGGNEFCQVCVWKYMLEDEPKCIAFNHSNIVDLAKKCHI